MKTTKLTSAQPFHTISTCSRINARLWPLSLTLQAVYVKALLHWAVSKKRPWKNGENDYLQTSKFDVWRNIDVLTVASVNENHYFFSKIWCSFDVTWTRFDVTLTELYSNFDAFRSYSGVLTCITSKYRQTKRRKKTQLHSETKLIFGNQIILQRFSYVKATSNLRESYVKDVPLT